MNPLHPALYFSLLFCLKRFNHKITLFNFLLQIKLSWIKHFCSLYLIYFLSSAFLLFKCLRYFLHHKRLDQYLLSETAQTSKKVVNQCPNKPCFPPLNYLSRVGGNPSTSPPPAYSDEWKIACVIFNVLYIFNLHIPLPKSCASSKVLLRKREPIPILLVVI